MRTLHPVPSAIAVCGLALTGCTDHPAGPASTASRDVPGVETSLDALAAPGAHTVAFADLSMFLEFNATDNDLGVQVFLDAEDWRRVRARSPDHRPILDIAAAGELGELGLTELRFESAEPSPEEVLALFAPGEYAFSGITVEGDKLVGVAILSHELPQAPIIVSPEEEEVVDPGEVEIVWQPIPGVASFEVIVSNEDTGASMDVELAGDVTSLVVPEAFLEDDAEYKVEVLAILPNGNKTITEGVFFTAP